MSPTLPANSPRFTFTCQSGPFPVYAFEGVEEVCKPYEFTVEFIAPLAALPLTDLPGTTADLAIVDKSGTPRLVNGLVREVQQLHTANRFTHYRCVIAPRLRFLDLITDHRIFQNLSVVEIIEKVLKEQGFSGSDVSFKLFYTYEPREYCVQYGETLLHFITRLCETEGIYFYFEHAQGSHTLCFCDREGGPPIAGEPALRFHPGSGHPADAPVIARLEYVESSGSNAAAYREWNFTKPRLNLAVSDSADTPAPAGMRLEQYRYPHVYQLIAQGKRYAGLQALRQATFSRLIRAQSDAARFLPTHTFSVYEHPRPDVNASWWITAVRHEGRQPGVLEHEAPDGRSLHYRSFVTAIPAMTRFIPPIRHPKRIVTGEQTAVVTGPEGEEIFPDKYGRVKVQFFWDREGGWNDKTTCWIRVSQAWAGARYGAEALPRIGHEVVVSFLEGDPDRPIITGRVHHALNMPAYELPDNKTRTVFKSMSTPGEENEKRGFNELRVEDRKGAEEIFGHAEKDVNIHVKNDRKGHIVHDRHLTVDNFSYSKVLRECHIVVEGPRKTVMKTEDHLTVHAEFHGGYKTKWLAKAGEEIHLESLMKAVLEAGADLTLKVGGSFVRLNAGGVTISGPTVKINSGGSAGVGTGARPLLPEGAIGTEEGERIRLDKLECALKLAKETNAGFVAVPAG